MKELKLYRVSYEPTSGGGVRYFNVAAPTLGDAFHIASYYQFAERILGCIKQGVVYVEEE